MTRGIDNLVVAPFAVFLGAALIFSATAYGQERSTDCPADALLAQPPDLGDVGDAFVSDEAGIYYVRYERFTALSGPVCSVRWWGFNVFNGGSGWQTCAEDPMPFVITFYRDTAGMPGAEVCSYAVEVSGTAVAEAFGWDLYRYEVILDSCCGVTDGWISIVGGGDPVCWFMWRSSPAGDDSNCVDDGSGIRCGSGQHYNDLSVCLTGGAPERIPTVSEWGFVVMTLLVLVVGTLALIRRGPLGSA